MNSLKLSPVAPAMMMFGGSPISVAVPPDVRRHDLDDDQGDRIDVEGVGQEEGDRDDEQDRRQVVEEGREQRRRAGEAEDHAERLAAGQLAGADRNEVVHPGLLGQVDQDHHSGEQPDRVEVDRLDGCLLPEARYEQDDKRGAEQRHLRPVQALARDQREGNQERRDRYRHCGPPGRMRSGIGKTNCRPDFPAHRREPIGWVFADRGESRGRLNKRW